MKFNDFLAILGLQKVLLSILMYLLYQRIWVTIINGREGGTYVIVPQIFKNF